MDLKEVQAICKDIEKKSGKGAIFMNGKVTSMQIPRWSTAIDDLDAIIGQKAESSRCLGLRVLERLHSCTGL